MTPEKYDQLRTSFQKSFSDMAEDVRESVQGMMESAEAEARARVRIKELVCVVVVRLSSFPFASPLNA